MGKYVNLAPASEFPKIDVAQIPEVQTRNLAKALSEAVTKFFDDPVNQAEFEKWKSENQKH